MAGRLSAGLFLVVFLVCHTGSAVGAGAAFIGADRLSAIYEKPSVAVVDVRPQSAFARRHVPGSINVFAFALPGKKVFYNKDVVLVGHGFALCRLLDLRDRMLLSGFKRVRILSGGIDAWKPESDMAPHGVKPFLLRAARKCRVLSPLVIDVRPFAAFSRRHIGGAVSVPFVRDEKKFLTRLARVKFFSAGAGRKPDAPIVFVSGVEAISIKAAAMAKKKKRFFSFYLSGGIVAWFLEKDYPEGKMVVGPGTNGCSSCPEAR